MARAVRWMAAVMAAAGLSVPAAAQGWKGPGRLEGQVVDAAGRPVPGATVRLILLARGGGTFVPADAQGRWAAPGLAAGEWTIDVEAEGYASRRLEATVPAGGGRVAPVKAVLDKVATPPTPAPELVGAVQKGDEAFRAGRWAEARRHYQRVLAARPDLAPRLHELIARSYAQEGDWTRSVEHLQHVLDANPDNVNLRVSMVEDALRAGLLDKALELLQGVDEGSITNAEVFFNIGLMLRRQGAEGGDEGASPVAYFTKAIALDPAHIDAHLQRGLAYRDQQRAAEARADFEKVVSLAPAGSAARQSAEQALAQLER